MNRTKVIETLNSLPENFSTEELMEKLIFIDKVEKGLQDVEVGKTITLNEAKKRFKQNGQNRASKIQ